MSEFHQFNPDGDEAITAQPEMSVKEGMTDTQLVQRAYQIRLAMQALRDEAGSPEARSERRGADSEAADAAWAAWWWLDNALDRDLGTFDLDHEGRILPLLRPILEEQAERMSRQT